MIGGRADVRPTARATRASWSCRSSVSSSPSTDAAHAVDDRPQIARLVLGRPAMIRRESPTPRRTGSGRARRRAGCRSARRRTRRSRPARVRRCCRRRGSRTDPRAPDRRRSRRERANRSSRGRSRMAPAPSPARAPRRSDDFTGAAHGRDEPPVPLAQPLECLACRDHRPSVVVIVPVSPFVFAERAELAPAPSTCTRPPARRASPGSPRPRAGTGAVAPVEAGPAAEDGAEGDAERQGRLVHAARGAPVLVVRAGRGVVEAREVVDADELGEARGRPPTTRATGPAR